VQRRHNAQKKKGSKQTERWRRGSYRLVESRYYGCATGGNARKRDNWERSIAAQQEPARQKKKLKGRTTGKETQESFRGERLLLLLPPLSRRLTPNVITRLQRSLRREEKLQEKGGRRKKKKKTRIRCLKSRRPSYEHLEQQRFSGVQESAYTLRESTRRVVWKIRYKLAIDPGASPILRETKKEEGVELIKGERSPNGPAGKGGPLGELHMSTKLERKREKMKRGREEGKCSKEFEGRDAANNKRVSRCSRRGQRGGVSDGKGERGRKKRREVWGGVSVLWGSVTDST